MLSRSLLAAALLAATIPVTATASDILGAWVRGDGAVRIRIARCGAQLCATKTWVRDADETDAVGDRLLLNVHQKGDGWHGTAYDPQHDVRVTANLKTDGNALISSGCLVGQHICRSFRWTRPQ